MTGKKEITFRRKEGVRPKPGDQYPFISIDQWHDLKREGYSKTVTVKLDMTVEEFFKTYPEFSPGGFVSISSKFKEKEIMSGYKSDPVTMKEALSKTKEDKITELNSEIKENSKKLKGGEK
jgi:hypothetical protein